MAVADSGNTQSRLQDIIFLLQNKKESLAASRSRLSLTSKQIQEICSALYSSSSYSQHAESSSLHNLLSNVKAIKIIPEPASSSSLLSETINLAPFHQLTHLEVRNIPIIHLSHLSQLRSQLHHLVLYACLDSLDDALQGCGGDNCSETFLWSELHSLHVTSCQTIDLGTGLQLAPWLKTLNLTFNELTDNSTQSLSTLMTLHSLTLDFNSLQRIPVLAPSARTTLKVLKLRQNQLDSLRGVEQLVSLEELDVAYNCISSGEALSALSFLPHLVKLSLEFNPLSYVKEYRLVVLRRVSSGVNRKKFRLDEQLLSSIEKDAVGTMAALYSIQPELIGTWSTSRLLQQQTTVSSSIVNEIDENSQNSLGAVVSEFQSSLGGSERIRPSPSSGKTLDQSMAAINPLSLSAVKRRKASRMREVEIADPPNLLPADSDSFMKSDQNTMVSTVVTLPTPSEQQPASSSSGHLTTKQRVEELRRVFGQENWLTSQAGNEVRLLLGWQETETQLTQSANTNNDEMLNPDQDTKSESSGKDDAILVLKSESDRNLPSEQTCVIASQGDSNDEDSDDLHVFVVQRQINSDLQEERLMTVSAAYLCEKDSLSGQTLSCWKRSSLQCVTVLQQSASPRSVVRVQLLFYSNFRNSTEAIYDMEKEDFRELEKILASCSETSTTTANPEKEEISPKDDMSCMKCDRKFPLVQAAIKLRSSAVSSPLLKGQLEEYSVCPYCASDMVFALEQQQAVGPTESCVSESMSSTSNQSGSDVIVTSNEPYSSSVSGGEEGSDTSEEGSVEVVADKVMRLATMTEYSVSPLNANGSNLNRKPTGKSLSSLSHSSKSSSQASNKNSSSAVRSTSSIRSTSSSIPSYNYSYADFSQVDHRLRLYCEMFLLGHQSEEFHGLIKIELVTMTAGPMEEELTPTPALLVITSHKVYFLRITQSNSSEQPESWLNLEISYPLSQLVSMLTVIGNQGVVLKFGTALPHLVLLRDQRRTKNVTHFLTGIVIHIYLCAKN